MLDLKDIPEDLKHIQPYLQRGQEVAKADPVVSYFCKYYAARLLIAKQGASPNAQSYLMKLVDELEEEKSMLQNNEAMKDDSTASQHCTIFALKIFAKADTEDRQGRANKMTARNFIVSSQFLQITAAPGELAEDVGEKIKYAKWRAAEILKAIREGREPEAPPGVEGGGEEQPVSLQSPQQPVSVQSPQQPVSLPSPQGVAGDIMNWPSPPQQQQQPQHQPQQPQHQQNPQQNPQHNPQQQWAPDGAYYHASPPPPPPQVPPSHNYYQPSSVAPQQQLGNLPSVPHNVPYSGAAPSHDSLNPLPQTMTAGPATFVPVPAASLPPVAREPTGSDSELLLDPADGKAAQKHARWAISALEYDDVNTAIENLQKAIQVLRPYQK